MRILILTQYFPPELGAPQVRLHAVARELIARGHAVDVVTAMPNYPRGEVFEAYRGRFLVREEVDGVPVTRTWIYAATGRNLLRRLANYLSFAVTALAGCFSVPRPDLVVVESPPIFLGVTAWLTSRLRRAPFVFNVSDLWPESAKELGVVTNPVLIGASERLVRFLYRAAWRVSAQTEGIRDAITRWKPEPGAVVFFPNGVDTSVFRPLPDACIECLKPGEVGLLYAGLHGYAQGLDIILEAAEATRDRPDIAYVLVGDGPERQRLVEAAEDRGLDNVRFVEAQPVTEMPRYFSAARASIVPLLPSPLFKGARPSKILPALACATPVIYSGEGEAARLIEEECCGLVVAPGSGAELARAARRLVDDAELAHDLGRNGRRLAEERFSWRSLVESWLQAVAPAALEER